MLIKTSFLLLFIALSAHCQSYKGGRFEQQNQNQGYDNQESGQYQEEGVAGQGNSVEEPEGAPEPPAVVPQTSFSCEGKPYDPGMYADMEVGCTVYHMCFSGRKESFLCGTGTVFNQEILSCDHPQNVDCNASPSYYATNEELGKPGAEPAPGGAPAPQRPRPIPQAPVPAPQVQRRPQAPRPRPQSQVQYPTGGYDEGVQAIPVAPRPRPAPGKVNIPRPAPVPSYRPAPAPRPVPRPVAPAYVPQVPVAPRPRPAPRPAPVYQPQPQVPAPRPRPSKTSIPRPKPAPRPIVQSTGEEDYNYEPSHVYYQEVPAKQVQYQSSANTNRRQWNQYRS